MDRETKQRELESLQQRVRELQSEISAASGVGASSWPPRSFYSAYYATTGFLLGAFAAATSLLVNIVGAPLAGKDPFELIKVYLTFPLGERAFSLTAETHGDLILAMGCCLYLGTGMLLGVPFYFLLVKFCGSDASLGRRLLVASGLAIAVWAVNFYGILSWLQPLLFGGNWITDLSILPIWVAVGTHLVFGWTLALLYPWGQFTPYQPQSTHT